MLKRGSIVTTKSTIGEEITLPQRSTSVMRDASPAPDAGKHTPMSFKDYSKGVDEVVDAD